MDCSTPGFPIHHQSPELAQTRVHLVGDAIQPSYPLSSPSPPAFNLSQHQGLGNELALLMRWPKYWSLSLNISPSNEHPGLISFRMDWLDLLEVQGTLKSLLQHHSSKASILRCPAFFIVHLSHPYMTTAKTIALTRRTFVGKVMALLFNMLSRLVITKFVTWIIIIGSHKEHQWILKPVVQRFWDSNIDLWCPKNTCSLLFTLERKGGMSLSQWKTLVVNLLSMCSNLTSLIAHSINQQSILTKNI